MVFLGLASLLVSHTSTARLSVARCPSSWIWSEAPGARFGRSDAFVRGKTNDGRQLLGGPLGQLLEVWYSLKYLVLRILCCVYVVRVQVKCLKAPDTQLAFSKHGAYARIGSSGRSIPPCRVFGAERGSMQHACQALVPLFQYPQIPHVALSRPAFERPNQLYPATVSTAWPFAKLPGAHRNPTQPASPKRSAG